MKYGKLLFSSCCFYLISCRSSLGKQPNYCACSFTLVHLIGTYEEYYYIPKGDDRYWLEKVELVIDSDSYGLGIPSEWKENCPKTNKLLEKEQVTFDPLFYGKPFYPKYLPSEVSNTNNLFYNVDSSRIIIAFNIRASVLKLKETSNTNCNALVKKRYYRFFNCDNDAFFKKDILGLVNSDYLGNLTEKYIFEKKYSSVRNINSFKYETGD